jgi:mannose-6-phosphate isomerase-like protein (cupin superfamily)
MKRNFSIAVKHFCDIPAFCSPFRVPGGRRVKFLLLILFMALPAASQERKVDPTWLRRYLPEVTEAKAEMASSSCHFQPIFGEGDHDAASMQSVTRFAEVTIDPRGSCQPVSYQREEEIYFVLRGNGTLQYAKETQAMRGSDFTYLPPGIQHSIANAAQEPLQVLVMGFRIPQRVAINPPAPRPTIVNMDSVKEESVAGHPSSVLYKLLLGPREGKRDAIDDAYVVASLFLMDFAPGGTNFPHHHEAAEEIYLVLDGRGEMVAGSGMDGIEGRFPSKAGDAYYFRPNCTVGFYNQNRPDAKAHILAVRSKISLPADVD